MRNLLGLSVRALIPTTPDSASALPDALLLLNAATQPAQMDGVHGGESAQEGCARPGSPLAPLRARGGDRAPPLLRCDRLRHCIGGAGGVPVPQARGGAATRFRGRRTLPMVRAPPCPIAADEPRS